MISSTSLPADVAPPRAEDAAREDAAQAPPFEAVYDEHVDFVWRSARRLGIDEASVDDVVQHVFLVVHRRLPTFEGRSSMKTWLFGILVHAAAEHRRTARRKRPHEAGAPDVETLIDTRVAADPERVLERAEASRVIDMLLASLDEEKRIVFVMAELEDMSAAEIGDVMGLDPKAVYSRLRAARTDFERAASHYRRDTLVTGRRSP